MPSPDSPLRTDLSPPATASEAFLRWIKLVVKLPMLHSVTVPTGKLIRDEELGAISDDDDDFPCGKRSKLDRFPLSVFLVFEKLFEAFENYIMDIHKTKVSQFLMFYACSLDPENCGVKFAVKLMDIGDHVCALLPDEIHPSCSSLSV
uniref:Uncharacterized protein n=1 Tax=Brassica campestris TaxID=3711 RepID=M4E4M3_BRACM